MGSWLLFRAGGWWGLTPSWKDNEMERSVLRGFPFRVVVVGGGGEKERPPAQNT